MGAPVRRMTRSDSSPRVDARGGNRGVDRSIGRARGARGRRPASVVAETLERETRTREHGDMSRTRIDLSKVAMERATSTTKASSGDEIWASLRQGGQELVEKEPLMGGFVYATILNQPTFERALAFLVASKIANATILQGQWNDLIMEALNATNEEGNRVQNGPGTGSISEAAREDLKAIVERDPACPSYTHAFCFFKGFQGLQAQRVSHWLWGHHRKVLACKMQSLVSEVFNMDLHPAAKFGRGIMIDHGHGVVVGETAVVDDGCTLLHGVTLGGTGKVRGDRHPKLGKRVVVGSNASVLGNITVGHDCKIGAGAALMHDLPPNTTVVGHKGRVVTKKTMSKL